MPIQDDERTRGLLAELRQNLTEIDRLSDQARRLLDDIEGKRDEEIERRVAQAIAALRAKSRMRSTAAGEGRRATDATRASSPGGRASKKAV